MDITIHTTSLPHDDPDASLAFYRDVLGFEVRTDVGNGQDALDHGRAPRTSPGRRSSWRRRPSTRASPTTSAAPSPR